ncbi:dipeptidase [Dinghuibacter silviterrae]|uniref:Membrane dipeptidase n=1 Tax=Dinghuibacter silviterrae TaxID=1539049 RepID=A0A4R8DU82_9BACT|nr:dipeptidase [Dinghuibacter silviterrae]TDX01709.1 membrane dipeptidase [Dinghuibacter silviterrae]
MRISLVAALLFTALSTRAQRLFWIDTHNDVLSEQVRSGEDLGRSQKDVQLDLPKAKAAHMAAQVFSIWCGEEYGPGRAFKRANQEIDSLQALAARNPKKMVLVRNATELKAAMQQHLFAALIGVEGGHMIEDRMDYLDSLARRGMVYMTLTWNNSTAWATSARDEVLKKDSLSHKGLTDKGRAIVARMNELGVMVDVSHVGDQTFYDVLAASTKPVIASHSSAFALDPNRRNLKDAQLKALAAKGGVVFVNFYSAFIDSAYSPGRADFLARHRVELDSLTKAMGGDPDEAVQRLYTAHPAEVDALRPPFALLIRHIDYMVKLIGADHVGIGADFDGAESYVKGMDDVRDYRKIAKALRKQGYSRADIQKIAGGNFLRVLAANRP